MQSAGLPGRRTVVGSLQPHTATSKHPEEILPPQRIDYRRAATHVKDASGAAMRQGTARPLIPGRPARTNTAPARER
jgi:hypothetical protein